MHFARASCGPSLLSGVELRKHRPGWVHSQDLLPCLGRLPPSLLFSMKSPVVLSGVADRFFFFFTLLPHGGTCRVSEHHGAGRPSHSQLSPCLLVTQDRQAFLPCWILSVGVVWCGLLIVWCALLITWFNTIDESLID